VKSRKAKSPTRVGRRIPASKSYQNQTVVLKPVVDSPPKINWIKWGCWLAFSYTLLGFQNHRWMFPGVRFWPVPASWQLLVVFVAGLAISIKLSRQKDAPTEPLPEKTAFWLLTAVLGLGIFVRFHYSSTPFGQYWFDEAVEPETTLRAIELGDYRNAFLGQYLHGVNPVHQWILFFIWYVKPAMTMLMAERLVGTAAFACSLLFLYLAGKEAVDRRMGIFAAVLGLLCKPIIQKSMSCHHADSMVWITALVMWRFFALLRKPGATRFLIWGAVTGFGVYTYTPYRILLPFFVMATLVWILVEQKDWKPRVGSVDCLAGITFVLFVVYILYTYVLFKYDTWFSRVVDVGGYWLPCMVLAVMVVLIFRWGPTLFVEGRSRLLLYWVGAVWVCVFVAHPLMTNPFVQSCMEYEGTQYGYHFHPLKSLNFLFDAPLFEGDQWDLTFPRDCLFGYTEIVFAAMGIALVCVKPNAMGLFLLATLVVGIMPHALTYNPNSLRAMFSVPPVLLLGALALNHIWQAWTGAFRGRFTWLLLVLLVALGGWTGRMTYERVFVQWADGFEGREICIYKRAIEDQKRGDRVFIGARLENESQYTLYEGRPVYLLRDANVLYWDVTEPGWNAVVYLSTDDGDVKKRISDAYPSVVWESLTTVYQGVYSIRGYRCVVPSAQLQSGNGGIFRVVRLEKPAWRRNYLNVAVQSDRPGLIQEQDAVMDPSAPPPHVLNAEAIQYLRVLHVNREGDYELDAKSNHRVVVVCVDGKECLRLVSSITMRFTKLRTDYTKHKTVHLKAGDHALSVVVFNEKPIELPILQLRSHAKPDVIQSIWNLSDVSVTEGS
jgi:hypothetical protein